MIQKKQQCNESEDSEDKNKWTINKPKIGDAVEILRHGCSHNIRDSKVLAKWNSGILSTM